MVFQAGRTENPGGVSPMALTLATRSVSEGERKRLFPVFPSLSLRVTGVQSVPLGSHLGSAELNGNARNQSADCHEIPTDPRRESARRTAVGSRRATANQAKNANDSSYEGENRRSVSSETGHCNTTSR